MPTTQGTLPRSAKTSCGRLLVCHAPSHLGAAEGMCMLVRHFLMQISMPLQVFATELIVRECLNNAIHHGNCGDPDKRVKLTVDASRERIRIRVADQGKGFNWRDAVQAVNTDSARPVGRGLAMIGAYASRIAFNPKGNVVTVDIATSRTAKGA